MSDSVVPFRNGRRLDFREVAIRSRLVELNLHLAVFLRMFADSETGIGEGDIVEVLGEVEALLRYLLDGEFNDN